MEILQDGSSEILEHIESLKRAKFANLLKNYGVENKNLEYNFTIESDDIILSILASEKEKICSGKVYLIGETGEIKKDGTKIHVFSKNQALDTVIGMENSDEIINDILGYKIASDQHPYFISVIMGAYIVGYDFDYIFTIKEKIWGMKNIEWVEQIVGNNLTDNLDD